MPRTSTELDKVFGEGSIGETEQERAKTSSRVFVRSQVQVAPDSKAATGHRMTALEAFDAFGWDVVRTAVENDAAPLIKRPDEPAATLTARRKSLNLSMRDLARAAHVSEDVVKRAETPGQLSSIRELESIAQALALDERLLGYVSGAAGDDTLSVRLREFTEAKDAQKFSSSDVLALTEAAWVITKQTDLNRLVVGKRHYRETFHPDTNYRFPTYEQGYRLAQETRRRLGLKPDQPIDRLKTLVEEQLCIPVVQQQLGDKFAGATVANGDSRGIVVNERGANSNVWVRRMTMAHELGHLLWDPDYKLNKLMVDRYDDIERDYSLKWDPVEIRANAFAISFLAPPEGMKNTFKDPNKLAGLEQIMMRFGISATAAKHHIKNTLGIDASDIPYRDLPIPSDDWVGRENLTIDWFPLNDTPISRRGRFAWLVASAFVRKLITADTAAIYLRCNSADFVKHVDHIINALG